MSFNKSKYKYNGAIHIHSLFSDGTGNIDLISKSAKKAGLSWIIITDHNNFDIEEGIINGVTVIKGEEISSKSRNHYLALGINECINPSENIQKSIETVRNYGGFGFAAHPDESDSRSNSHKPIKWTDKNIIPDGIEIWNWFSQWADNYNSKNIFNIAYSYFFKNKLVKKPYRVTLDWWDRLNNKEGKIVPAIGGIDAHALKIKDYIFPVTVFPYKFLFKTITNQIILNEPLDNNFDIRKKQIITALKNGNNLIFNRQTLNQPPDFYITNDSEYAESGNSVALDLNTYLHFNCNKKAEIKIYKNGSEIANFNNDKAELKITDCGKYRLEAEINGYGYVYSNPIIVNER